MHDIWTLAQPPLPLHAHEAHIWLALLDYPADITATWLRLLSEQERRIAAQFYFERDRRRYIVAHTFLRRILGAYLDLTSEELSIAVASHGKPYLIRQPDMLDIRFNLSHSHDAALLALTLDCDLGVDIESATPLDDADLIATQFFSLAERTSLRELPLDEKNAAFYRCWSRKEAVIKAVGLGLAMPLNDFDVSLAPSEPAQLLAIRGASASPNPWTLYDLPQLPGFASALAVARPLDRIECRRWTPQLLG